MVAELCERLGIPHATLPVMLDPGNMQDRARAARYAALGDWLEARGLAALLTAHHANDQAETLLMRLNRGSGLAGLAGVRGRSVVPGTGLPLLRPLLGWRREELRGVVDAAGLVPALDPGNSDPRYDRARIRGELARAPWLDSLSIARSAAHLADGDEALEWATGREYAECVSRDGSALLYRPQAPRAVRLRVIARLLGDLGGSTPRGGEIATLLERLEAGSNATLGGILARPLKAGWRFAPEARRG